MPGRAVTLPVVQPIRQNDTHRLIPPKDGQDGAGKGLSELPGHKVLLVDNGIPIIETLDLESLSAAGAVDFLFVMSPLKLVGATVSPVRPLAIMPGA